MNEQEQKKPKCFDSELQWAQYQKFWILSQGTGRVRYCTDCLPNYRDEMIEQGRCAHPETVFVEENGEMTGVNGMLWSTWLHTVSGKRGIVVSPPDKMVRDQFIAETYRQNRGAKKYKRMSVRKKPR